jgi:hypothetical protein
MRGQLQVPLHRSRVGIGQQRVAQRHRDEGAEFGQGRGFGAGQQFPAVALDGARRVASRSRCSTSVTSQRTRRG